MFFLATIHIVAGKKNPKIIFENDEYLINRKLQGKTMWRCAQYNKTKCRSRIITFGKVLKFTHDHNHHPINPQYENTFPQNVVLVKKFPIM